MKRKLGLALGVLALALVLLAVSRRICVSAWLNDGVVVSACPSGRFRMTANVRVADLRRGAEGSVIVEAVAHYTTAGSQGEETAAVAAMDSSLTLVDGQGKETALRPARGWVTHGPARVARITLPPELADGEYRLRARVVASIGEETVEVPLGFYAPARVHVITDRPLYEPGHTIRFRAVVLGARDLRPVEGRPGTWIVSDAAGEVLLEEKVASGPWGVVAGSLPIDSQAGEGVWTVAYQTGQERGEIAVTVKPFTLPRFRVEAAPDRPFYRRGEVPALSGQVTYSSGAPVANALLEVTWISEGAWPPPTEWMEKGLPRRARTGAGGRFALKLPPVPQDLRGEGRLTARIAAADAAGDRVEGAASVLFSEDAIAVSAVSELAEGLVAGFNNRLYLRVTTADGRVLDKAKIRVRRAWSPEHPAVEAALDEDGVAALQIDPGPPVNVVLPAMPVRPPAVPLVTGEPIQAVLGDAAPLADQAAVEGWLAPLARCARWADEEDGALTVALAVRVDPSGRIASAVTAGGSPFERCVRDLVEGERLAPGGERLYTMTFHFREPDAPSLTPTWQAAVGEAPEELVEQVEWALRDARECLPREVAAATLPEGLTWRVREGQTRVDTGWMPHPDGSQAAAPALACLRSRLRTLALRVKADHDAMGVAELSLSPAPSVEAARGRDTVMLGYELEVEAEVQGKAIGSTKVRLRPGAVPPLRLRATPVVASAGETIAVEAIRGPDYRGDLPGELVLSHARGEVKTKLDPEARTATFAIEEGVEGWCEIAGGGGRALVYVKPRNDLAVTIGSERPRYAPGEVARLLIETRIAGQGAQAAVGLFGVDATMAQLAVLPGADDLAGVRPQVTMAEKAFDAFDAQALVLGRIRGAHAAAATVLRVNAFVRVPGEDPGVSASVASHFDATEELTDRFYAVLDQLYVEVRRWEAEAPQKEKMRPPVMAKLWGRALAAARQRGERVTDAWGRELVLANLPRDLLALTDPRELVADGTRLPEDVENWIDWVEKQP